MRIRTKAAAAALLVLAGLAAPAAASNEIPKGVEWVKEWDAALQAAAERGVPILVSFANDD